MTATTIVGSHVSPYVRKVLVCLDLKGVAYEIDPLTPFFGNDEFSRLSPVRRIPLLIDDRITISDSTVICEYLDERYPEPALLPRGAVQRARARWLEEFADSRMGEVFIWHYFNQLIIKKHIWREPPDEQVVTKALEEEIPQVLDYLESQLPPHGYFFGPALSLADISVATFFRNAGFARFAIDATRWPKTAAFVNQALEHPSFKKLRPFEEISLRTPLPEQRAALQAAGESISAKSFATATPRRGVLSI